MTGNRRTRGPLVAEKRYAKAAAEKSAPTPRASASRGSRRGGGRGGRGGGRPPRRPGVLGWIAHVVSTIVRGTIRLVWGIGWRLGAISAVLLGGWVLYVASTLPPMTDLVDGRARGSVTLLDNNGQVFAWRGDQFGGMITADTVSPHLHNAVVATEDKRFYSHFGLSPRGIASAIRINLAEGRGPLSGNGGSTITQQTAKLLCLGDPYDPDIWETEAAYESDCRRTTLWRKAKEAVFAMAMELSYTKEEILTLYLNRAYLGAGTRGFEAAAQRYFGISANEVSPSQAAILAGLLKAPTTYAPTNNLQRSWDRASVVIGLMEEQGYLTAAQANDARTNPAQLSQAAQQRAGGYFADWVMDSGPEFFTSSTTEDVVIRTTLDPRIQAAAEEALVWVFENKVREGSEAQAAIVVMSADGAVRAMVGGRDLQASGAFNRATQALRQTGSLFKPFVYATALELGMSPYDIVVDEPFCMTIPGSGEWCPANYSRDFRGAVPLVDALVDSLNIPAIKISELAGRENVRTIAQGVRGAIQPCRRAVFGFGRVGIDSDRNDGRLCGDTERRLIRYALWPDRPTASGRKRAADGHQRRHRRTGHPARRRAATDVDDESGGRTRHRRARASGRLGSRGQDGHHSGLARCVVHRLYRRLRDRHLDGLRQQHTS